MTISEELNLLSGVLLAFNLCFFIFLFTNLIIIKLKLQSSNTTDRNISKLTVIFLTTLIVIIVISIISYLDVLLSILKQNLTAMDLFVKNKLKLVLKKIVVLVDFNFS